MTPKTSKIILIFILFIASVGVYFFYSSDTATTQISTTKTHNMPTTQNLKTISVIFLGDSLTEGYGLDKDDSYPSQLEQKLNAITNKEGLQIQAIHGGLSGDTTVGGLARIDWFLKAPSDFVFVALGANDGLRGIEPSVMKDNLEQIIQKAQAVNSKVILAGMQMPINYGADFRRAFGEVFIQLQKEYDLYFYPFLLDGVASDEGLNLPDGIHPNAKGYEIISDKLTPFFLDIFKQEGIL